MRRKKYFKNITIDQFFKSPDIGDYETYIKFLKSKNMFNGKTADLEELTLSEVGRIRELVQHTTIENLLELYQVLYKVDAKEFLAAKILDLFHSNRFIFQFLEGIAKKEKLLDMNISDEDRSKWSAAGGERLNQFKEFGIMVALGQQFSKSPEEIGDWKYNLCFGVMLYNSISRDIDSTLARMNIPKPSKQ